jgi:hypothetical protein
MSDDGDEPLQQLRHALQRQPFVPFEMDLPGGERLRIDDPAALAFRGDVAVYIHPDGECTLLKGTRAYELVMQSPGLSSAGAAMVPNGLLAAQLLGICCAVLAATIEIETIVGTGPALSILGLFVATNARNRSVGVPASASGLGKQAKAWTPARSRRTAWVGISTLMFSLLVFGVINVAEWGPSTAQHKVSAMALVYEAIVIPAGIAVMWPTRKRRSGEQPMAAQFSLRSLLLLVALAGVVLGAARVAYQMSQATLTAIAAGFLVATLLALVATYLQSRRMQDLSRGSEGPRRRRLHIV